MNVCIYDMHLHNNEEVNQCIREKDSYVFLSTQIFINLEMNWIFRQFNIDSINNKQSIKELFNLLHLTLTP